jgi:putative colanic acid biosynthesis acetyltransferase WcaF
MLLKETRLDLYNNSWYNPGGSKLKRLLWYFINAFFFNSSLFPVSFLKVSLLKLFGAKIGKGVVIKPNVNIKYPWLLEIGNFSWIGEEVWIDNLALIKIGNHACISQGALLLCGNHNYSSSKFDLMVGEIKVEDGSWVGAKSIVCPGSILKSHAVLAAGSVGKGVLESYSVYQGNPAIKTKLRTIS